MQASVADCAAAAAIETGDVPFTAAVGDDIRLIKGSRLYLQDMRFAGIK